MALSLFVLNGHVIVEVAEVVNYVSRGRREGRSGPRTWLRGQQRVGDLYNAVRSGSKCTTTTLSLNLALISGSASVVFPPFLFIVDGIR